MIFYPNLTLLRVFGVLAEIIWRLSTEMLYPMQNSAWVSPELLWIFEEDSEIMVRIEKVNNQPVEIYEETSKTRHCIISASTAATGLV